MPRKPKAGVAAEVTLTLRMTDADRALLDRLVAMRAAELVDLGAEEVDVTAASFVRGLIRREAKAKGLMPAAAAPPAVAKVEATTTPAEEPASASRDAAEEPDKERIHAALERAIKKGEVQGQLADRAGVDRSALSRFRKTHSGLSSDRLRRLEKVL